MRTTVCIYSAAASGVSPTRNYHASADRLKLALGRITRSGDFLHHAHGPGRHGFCCGETGAVRNNVVSPDVASLPAEGAVPIREFFSWPGNPLLLRRVSVNGQHPVMDSCVCRNGWPMIGPFGCDPHDYPFGLRLGRGVAPSIYRSYISHSNELCLGGMDFRGDRETARLNRCPTKEPVPDKSSSCGVRRLHLAQRSVGIVLHIERVRRHR